MLIEEPRCDPSPSRFSLPTSASRKPIRDRTNDNPFSEAHFRTLKYRPDLPERFASIQHAREHCLDFFAWYNDEHRHSGLALMTPRDVHQGKVNDRLAARKIVLDAAFAANPERFVRGRPRPEAPPEIVWINPPKLQPQAAESEQVVA